MNGVIRDALLAAALGTALAAQAPAPLAVGILFRDGTLLPFAAFDGRAWTAWWPEPDSGDRPAALPSPPALDRVPREWLGALSRVPRVWYARQAGGALKTIRAQGLTRIRLLLADGVAISTRAAADNKAVRALFHEDQQGVAISVPRSIRQVRDVTADPQPCRRLFDALRADTRVAADAAIRDLDASPTSRALADAVRRGPSKNGSIDLEIEACFAGPPRPDGSAVYYVAASHRYPVTPASLETGDALFEIDGWVDSRRPADGGRLLNGGFRASIRSTFSFTTSVEPLAVLPFGPSQYWVVADHLEDGIEYGIYEVTPMHAQRVNIEPLAR
jgi:hypothetical protein